MLEHNVHTVRGGCHCGNIAVELALSAAPETYQPRACDCDFCRKHGAAYVSDPQGALAIHIRSEDQSGRYRQGSATAELLVCRNCGVLVGALYRAEGRLYASVNARTLEATAVFGSEQPVSPRKLSAPDKVQRWQRIWFADVSITVGPQAPAPAPE